MSEFNGKSLKELQEMLKGMSSNYSQALLIMDRHQLMNAIKDVRKDKLTGRRRC